MSKEKGLLENEIKLLNTPDSELDEKEAKLEKVERRLNKKIDNLGDDIESEFKNIIRKGKEGLEDIVDASCRKMNSDVDGWGIFSSAENIMTKINIEIEQLTSRKLPRELKRINEEAERKVKSTIADFFDDAQNIFDANIEDFDANDFITSVSNKIEMEIDGNGLFDLGGVEEDDLSIMGVFFKVVFMPVVPLGRAISHDSKANEIRKNISSISSNFDAQSALDSILENKEFVIDTVKSEFIDGLIIPMKKQIEECKKSKGDKEQKIKEDQGKLARVAVKLRVVEKQIFDIDNMI